MNSKFTKISRCVILSVLAFSIIAMPYGTGNPTFAQEQVQQQQGHPAPIAAQNTSEPMQDPSQGNDTNQTLNLEIKRAGSQPSTVGPAEYFTGSVRIDPVFEAKDPSRLVVATVTFEPGAHTAWHIHPLGQILIVTAGCGLIQTGDDPVEEICPGDVIWT
jgi:quercetin dioxygenase-like cupin family protein